MERIKGAVTRVLRASERYTKTDMVYLASGGFWLGVGHVIQALAGFLVAVMFANLISKESYGTYQFIMAAAGIVATFTLTGLDALISREVARGNDGALRYGFRVKLRWGMGIIIAAVGGALYYFSQGNATIAIGLLIAGACMPFITSFGMSQDYLVGKQLFRETAILGIGRKFLPVIAVLVALLMTKNILVITAAYFAAHALSAGLLYFLIVRNYRLPITPDPVLIAYSRHLTFLKTFSKIAEQADKVLVFHYLGAVAVAVYSLAQLPVNHLRSAMELVLSLTYSKIAQTGFAELQTKLSRKVTVFFGATVLAVGCYAAIAPLFFALFFNRYPEAVLVSQILALSVLAVPRALYWQALTAHQKKPELYAVTISQNVLRIGLLFVLLPRFGIWGAVATAIAMQAYLAGVQGYLFYRAR